MNTMTQFLNAVMREPMIDFEFLKAKQRNLRSGFPGSLGLRVHRAISWLERAEKEVYDPDAAFIFYWIAFNAAYAADIRSLIGPSERSSFDSFFEKLISIDSQKQIYATIWNRFAGPIRLLLDNRYVFQPFWNHHNGIEGYIDWAEALDRSRTKLKTALARQDTKLVLTTLFDRLYVLRNQLLHGGATWGSSVNREQVQDGARILESLVPIFVDLMLDNPYLDWGAPFYPVVEDSLASGAIETSVDRMRKRRSLRPNWFENRASNAELESPGIYEWRIEGIGLYVGKSSSLKTRLKRYPKNVLGLINGDKYHIQGRDYRDIHRRLRDAHEGNIAVSFCILENCPEDTLNVREEHWIAVRRSTESDTGLKVFNATKPRTQQ